MIDIIQIVLSSISIILNAAVIILLICRKDK